MSQRFRRVKPDRKLYETIVNQIQGMIISGELRPGERLPSERELADAFGVGRPTVREATKVLESKGLLEMRRGSGVFVSPAIQDALLDSLNLLVQYNQCTPEMIYEVRRVQEVSMARLAAMRADEEDLAAMRATLSAMEATLDDIDSYNQADLAFHRAMAEATHNQMFIILAEFLLKGTASVIRLVTQTRNNAARGLSEHRRVFEAIVAGDADRARQAMQDHLTVSQQELHKIMALAELKPSGAVTTTQEDA